jgi:hypothetical protein
MQQLELNRKHITKCYGSFVNSVRKAMQETSPKDLSSWLIALPAINSGDTKEIIALMSGVCDQLQKATSVDKIFNILSIDYGASFINFEVFVDMADNYGVQQDARDEYIKHLDAYIKMHIPPQVMQKYFGAVHLESHEAYMKEHELDVIDFSPQMKLVQNDSKKMLLKFDIEKTCTLAKIQDLKKNVANILHMKASALRTLNVEEGCVIVTFLIPSQAADYVFSSDSVFTTEDVAKFRSLSVLWLKCNGYVYEFNNLHVDTHDREEGGKQH